MKWHIAALDRQELVRLYKRLDLQYLLLSWINWVIDGNRVSVFLAESCRLSYFPWSCIALPLKAQWSEAVRCRAPEALPLSSVTWINPGDFLGRFCCIQHCFSVCVRMNTCELRRFVLPKYGFEGSPKVLPEAGFVHFLGRFEICVAGSLWNDAAVRSTRVCGWHHVLATGAAGRCLNGFAHVLML